MGVPCLEIELTLVCLQLMTTAYQFSNRQRPTAVTRHRQVLATKRIYGMAVDRGSRCSVHRSGVTWYAPETDSMVCERSRLAGGVALQVAWPARARALSMKRGGQFCPYVRSDLFGKP
jgi:hypothetical protein